ncbi:hypothetical protein, partial [Oleiphilus sp. HI0132]|uniref:hypothetical protein n=1 Tax=Oleiphilus sp. HI0132 TaxID=1822270 RepID=UPI000B007228
NWYVISGINRAKNNIFYFKVLKDKDWVTGYNELKFNLEYPLDDKNKYKLLPGQVKLFTNN